MILVQKYGGSSLTDVACIRRVAQRVVATVEAGHQVVVVVSAMGNTTNELLSLAQSVSPRPGRRELDLLVSVGERVSMTLLAMAIQDLGVAAASFTGSQSGIITNEDHVQAQVVEVRPHRIAKALEQGNVAIVAGFQGVSRAGDVTTLGRGGSDTTAVVLTAALGAAYCEICSDVDAIYTADPRVVDDAVAIDTLSLDAASALTGAGSRVLASEAVQQARKLGVELRANATARPSGQGTRLQPGPMPTEPVALAVDSQLEWVQFPRDHWPDLPCPVRVCVASQDRVDSLLELQNFHDRGSWQPPAEVVSHGTVSAITVVGELDAATVGRAVGVVDKDELHWWVSTSAGLTLVVPSETVASTQKALHAALLNPS